MSSRHGRSVRRMLAPTVLVVLASPPPDRLHGLTRSVASPCRLGYIVVVLSNFGYPTIAPAIEVILNRLRIP